MNFACTTGESTFIPAHWSAVVIAKACSMKRMALWLTHPAFWWHHHHFCSSIKLNIYNWEFKNPRIYTNELERELPEVNTISSNKESPNDFFSIHLTFNLIAIIHSQIYTLIHMENYMILITWIEVVHACPRFPYTWHEGFARQNLDGFFLYKYINKMQKDADNYWNVSNRWMFLRTLVTDGNASKFPFLLTLGW